jgi:hypothetical protein
LHRQQIKLWFTILVIKYATVKETKRQRDETKDKEDTGTGTYLTNLIQTFIKTRNKFPKARTTMPNNRAIE